MGSFRKFGFRLRKNRDNHVYSKLPSDASAGGSRNVKGLCFTRYPSAVDFDFAIPQISPLDLRIASEIKRDEEYLFSAFSNGCIRIDRFEDEKLLEVFNIDSPLQVLGYTSSRLVGIDVPRILGLAPSLNVYHTLWRFRYTLEIQLTYSWGEFQTRFNWAGITDQAIRTSSFGSEVRVIRELLCLLRLTKDVLSTIYDEKPPDCTNCWGFVLGEVVSLGRDIRMYKEKLRICLMNLDQGEYHRASRLEDREKEAYKKRMTSDTSVDYQGRGWDDYMR